MSYRERVKTIRVYKIKQGIGWMGFILVAALTILVASGI
jgi:hypothetical protein